MKSISQKFLLQSAIHNFNSVNTFLAQKNKCRLRFFLFGYFFSFFVAVQKRKSNKESSNYQINMETSI